MLLLLWASVVEGCQGGLKADNIYIYIYINISVSLLDCTHIKDTTHCFIVITFSIYRSVPQIRAPLFATLVSVQNAGGLYVGRDDFSRDYARPSGTCIKYDLIVGGGWGPSARYRRAQSGEMLATLPVVRRYR